MQRFPAINSKDVERYRTLRSQARQLCSQMLETVPHEAIAEIGKTLGIERDGVLVFDSMDLTSVLMDACLFDWLRNGKTLAEKYFEAHPVTPGTREYALEQAYTHPQYRILLPEEIDRGAAVYCLDILSAERLILIDIGLSETLAQGVEGIMATRTIPLGNFWMTTGAALPVGTRAIGQAVLQKIRDGRLLEDKTPEGEHRLALVITRACLDSGAGKWIRYQTAGETESEQDERKKGVEIAARRRSVPRPTGHVGRNELCSCGSGKKFKRCCGR